MGIRVNRRDAMKAGVAAVVATAAARGKRARAENSGNAEKPALKVDRLADHAITHGGNQEIAHARLGAKAQGQTCIRYLRFGQTVQLDRLEIGRLIYGRATPAIPTHPAHVVVSILDASAPGWSTVRDVEIPPNPKILGEGLSQSMSAEEMETRLAPTFNETAAAIDLGGLRTDHLRVICDLEHPVWPNHGECNGGGHNVPFGILNNLRAFGSAIGTRVSPPPPPRILTPKTIRPVAPKGMKCRVLPGAVRFEGKYLSIGFSSRRPLLTHLGWDALGQGQAANNRLLVTRRKLPYLDGGAVSGPILRTLQADYPASLWTGEVSVDGSRVSYTNLHAGNELRLDVVFTVEKDRITVEISQVCAVDLPVVEAEAWRFAWDLTAGITGIAGAPTGRLGRNGDVALPAMFATDGVGCLACRQIEATPSPAHLQVESYREANCVTSGFVFASREDIVCQCAPAGKHRSVFELAVTNVEPKSPRGLRSASVGLKRHWGTVFSCYRPEFRGFSNHSASVNCHLSQGPPIEIVASTKRPDVGPNPLDLARFTIGRALMDGGGYGYCRNLYLDSDPILLSAAGRIHQADPDTAWLHTIEPGLVETVERILSHAGKDGLVVCKDLSGNSGSYRWSSNSMDVVGFGHLDAYVNAWSYRAFRNATALLGELPKHTGLATRCREAAMRLRQGFAAALVNPETGWVAGWRSRDGQLHDYAFTWVNGAAIAFGLLEKEPSRKALHNLERARSASGLPDARLGLPCNLLPIRENDQMWAKIVKQLQPTFETYTDGSLSGWPATYYLRALSLYGMKDRAKTLARELSDGYAAGVFNGGSGTGREFCSWEGLPTGYEGTLIGCFGPLYGIAIEEGVLEPATPEWWPANG
ncbi:MAG: hypothetical protein HZB26_01460 [Candidatus Hydrogenedentes bacterium]|nr:hypothetical protein [Candidatus Hydrogenedentota bacterium]